MIRLAIIEQESRMGGVEYSTLYLATTLDRQRFTPIVIAPEHGPLVQRCQAESIPVLLAPRPRFRSTSFRIGGRTIADMLAMVENPVRLMQAADYLHQVLCSCSPDLILTKGLLAHFYGGLVARRLNTPCIWHVQDEVSSERAGGLYLRVLQQSAHKLADAVVADAATIATQFHSHPHVYTVYNGVDTCEYAPGTAPGTLRTDLGIPKDALVIGNIARLTDWKGQHVLIKAFNRIAPAFPAAHLVLIGSPLFDDNSYEQKLRWIAGHGPASDRIHFAGYRTDIAASLAEIDIYTHPSLRKDTAPLALLSAFATGLPTIISEVPGMVEVVEPEVSALVVPTGDVEKLGSALTLLLKDPTRRALLGASARTTAQRRFSIAAHTTAMLNIFMTVLGYGTNSPT